MLAASLLYCLCSSRALPLPWAEETAAAAMPGGLQVAASEDRLMPRASLPLPLLLPPPLLLLPPPSICHRHMKKSTREMTKMADSDSVITPTIAQVPRPSRSTSSSCGRADCIQDSVLEGWQRRW